MKQRVTPGPGGHELLQISIPDCSCRQEAPGTIRSTMKFPATLLLALVLWPAHAQPQPHGHRDFQRPMPAPERRLSWEERQRLREQVRSGQMTREEARERWREERARRAGEDGRFTPEQREQLRRDVLEANRDLPKR